MSIITQIVKIIFILTILSIIVKLAASKSKLPRRNETLRRIRRLVGGENVEAPHEAPFVVQLIRSNRTVCTGTIIGDDTILTAAHCIVKGVEAIVYGSVWKYPMAKNSTAKFKMAPVKRVHVHPDFVDDRNHNDQSCCRKKRNNNRNSADIAVIVLKHKILPDSISHPIRLPNLDDAPIRCGTRMRVYGFGKSYARNETKFYRNFEQPARLQVMETQVSGKCTFWLAPTSSRRSRDYIITQIQNKTVCFGDSGGPLIGPNGILAGITSRSSCIRGKHDFFVDISKYRSFIRQFRSTTT